MPDTTTRRGRFQAVNAARAGSVGPLAVCLLLSGCGLFITPQHRIAVASKDIKAGRWQEAAFELRTVIQRDDGNAGAWQLLAELSLDAADLNGAQSALTHALAAGARGPDFDALRIQAWLAAGQPQTVLDAITRRTVDPGEPRRSLALARAYLALGRADDALQTLRPVVAQQPDLTEARVVIAAALAHEGQLDQALAELDGAMQHDSTSPLPRLMRGSILASRGQYGAAEASLMAALQRMPLAQPLPDRGRALVLLTEARLAQGKTDAAAASQSTLAKLAPSAVAGLLGARIELARGDLTDGVDKLEGVVAQVPGYTAARLYLGAAELARGDLQQAQEQLQHVVQAAPDNLEARKLLATARLDLGEPESALAVLIPTLGAQTADPQLLSLAGAAGSRTGNGAALVRQLERKLHSDPKNEPLALNVAGLQARTGDLAAARSTLEAALTTSPNSVPLRLKLARVALAQGDLKAAQSVLDQAIASQRGQAPVVEQAGILLLDANQYDAALARLAQATTLEPDNALYWLNAARAQLALNQTAAARESLGRAAQIHPQWLPAVGMLALMDLHAGDGPGALRRVDAVIGGKPRDAGALALRGYVEAALGNSAAAVAAYEQAQEIRPTAVVAVQLYRLKLGSHSLAPAKPLQDWLTREPNDWRVHAVLAEYFLGQRSWRPAAAQLEAALQEEPQSVVALNNLAWIYSAIGDPRAESLAERAYQLEPQSGEVDDTLGWILANQHESARAVPLLAEAARRIPADPEIAYHYAYALIADGNPGEGRRILTRILSTSQPFASRVDAQRLLNSKTAI